MELLGATRNPGEIARYLNSMGVAAVLAGKIDEGIATYGDAIKILSGGTKVHFIEYNLALAYKRQGDLAKAFTLMAKSFLACPHFEKAYAGFVRVTQELRAAKAKVDETVVASVTKARQEAVASSAAAKKQQQ
jgi:hypothetical protein